MSSAANQEPISLMKKVMIPTKLDSVARATLEQSGRFSVVQDDKTDILALARQHPDTWALIVRSEVVNPALIDALPALKVVVRAGSGYNTIDTRYARTKGIDVMNTPGANANAVAEEVVALMLADSRFLVPADASVRAGEWEKKKFMGREITGKTLGIVGLGYVGQMVARRLASFEMTAIGYDPVVSAERARALGIELVELPELFRRSDYISLHVPETDQTRGMVNATLLAALKPGATIINCARAGIINLADLRAAKKTKSIRFLTDVFAKDEPGLKPEADIADLMAPHLGASTREANENAARRAAIQLVEFDEKGIASYIVNRAVPAGLDEAYGDLAYTLARLCRQVVGDDAPLKLVETSFYGQLQPFAGWLSVPTVAALATDFDRASDARAAVEYLKSKGIQYHAREPDETKGYGNSITIDLTAGVAAGPLRTASVRGTVTEGTLTVSRINDFHRLYFEPRGHLALFCYRDRPGVLGRIGSAIAQAGINIEDLRMARNSDGDQQMAILLVSQPIPEGLVAELGREIEATTAFYVNL
jgi:D-3-phosphoglycerate dehydrogenase / 2-oxoglutarate reductase